MSGYIEAGYVVGLGTLLTYAGSLVARERAARRRLPAAPAGRRLPAAPAGRRDAEPAPADDERR